MSIVLKNLPTENFPKLGEIAELEKFPKVREIFKRVLEMELSVEVARVPEERRAYRRIKRIAKAFESDVLDTEVKVRNLLETLEKVKNLFERTFIHDDLEREQLNQFTEQLSATLESEAGNIVDRIQLELNSWVGLNKEKFSQLVSDHVITPLLELLQTEADFKLKSRLLSHTFVGLVGDYPQQAKEVLNQVYSFACLVENESEYDSVNRLLVLEYREFERIESFFSPCAKGFIKFEELDKAREVVEYMRDLDRGRYRIDAKRAALLVELNIILDPDSFENEVKYFEYHAANRMWKDNITNIVNNAFGYAIMARALHGIGQVELAEKYTSLGLELMDSPMLKYHHKDQPSFVFEILDVLITMGKKDEVNKRLQKMQSDVEKELKGNMSKYHFNDLFFTLNIADCHLKLGQKDKAREVLRLAYLVEKRVNYADWLKVVLRREIIPGYGVRNVYGPGIVSGESLSIKIFTLCRFAEVEWKIGETHQSILNLSQAIQKVMGLNHREACWFKGGERVCRLYKVLAQNLVLKASTVCFGAFDFEVPHLTEKYTVNDGYSTFNNFGTTMVYNLNFERGFPCF